MTAPSRARALAQLAAALVSVGTAAAIAAACGADTSSAPAEPDGGSDDGGVVQTGCPKAQPPSGTECLLPEGTTCEFGQCGSRLSQCLRGVWKTASNAPPRPPCPAVAPNQDVKCPDCWSPEVSCPYGSTDCSLPDASDNRTIASCPDGRWVLDFRPCRDAGPDVQGDGGPDAD